GAAATARVVSATGAGAAATDGRIDGGVEPIPELAAVLKAATGLSPRAVFTAATSAAPLVMPLLPTPPEAVRQVSETTLASREHSGLLPSWSSVPIWVPFRPTR